MVYFRRPHLQLAENREDYADYNVKKGEIIELLTSFLPTLGIDIMKSKGYSVWTHKEGDGLIKSYFHKNLD